MSFDVLRGMPIGLLALRSRVAEKSGEHTYFPNGQTYWGYHLREVTPKPRVFEGWTARFFVYLPKTLKEREPADANLRRQYHREDRSEFKVQYHRNNIIRHLGVRNTNGYFDLALAYVNRSGFVHDPKTTLKPDIYFSVALRAKTPQHFVGMMDERELYTADMGSGMLNYDWELHFKTGVQTLLSWHITDEVHGSSTRWGTYLTLERMTWPTGTVATITVFVSDVPSDPKITLRGSSNTDVRFSRSNLRRGSTVHFTVALSAQRTYVRADFDPDKVGEVVSSGAVGQYSIRPQFPQGFWIHKIENVAPSFYAPEP